MARIAKISDMVKALARKDSVIIDVLEAESYKRVHIKDAINIPIENLEEEILEKVDRDTPVILYSIDVECPVSRIAAKKMEDMGYIDVSYYPGGKEEWLVKDMPVERN